MGYSILPIRFRDFASKFCRLTKLSFSLGLLSFVVLMSINLLSSSLWPSFYGNADRAVIFMIAHIAYLLGILIAPITVAIFGCKPVLIMGAVGVTITLLTLFWPIVVVTYIISVVVGFSVAIIIIAGYTFIANFTKPENVSRNAAVIYTTIEIAQLLSNGLLYFCMGFLKTPRFTYWTFGMLVVFAIIGIILIYITSSPEEKDPIRVSGRQRVYNECVQFIGLSTKTDTLLLMPIFFYTGILLALLQGNYGTWPTFTIDVMNYGIDFGTCCSMTIITSEVVCGIMLIVMGIEIEGIGRATTAVVGFIFQGVACFFLIGLVPKDGTFSAILLSAEMGNSGVTIIIMMAVLLGFGVALMITQIYAKLMEQYTSTPAAAVTVFKAIQALGIFTALYYSRFISLPYQSTICLLIGLFSIFGFIFAERSHSKSDTDLAEPTTASSPSNEVL